MVLSYTSLSESCVENMKESARHQRKFEHDLRERFGIAEDTEMEFRYALSTVLVWKEGKWLGEFKWD